MKIRPFEAWMRRLVEQRSDVVRAVDYLGDGGLRLWFVDGTRVEARMFRHSGAQPDDPDEPNDRVPPVTGP